MLKCGISLLMCVLVECIASWSIDDQVLLQILEINDAKCIKKELNQVQYNALRGVIIVTASSVS